MKITHVAVWTENLEEMRSFYESCFGGESGKKYVNPKTGFESYFVKFGGEASLELMRRRDIVEADGSGIRHEMPGYCHLAFSAGSEEDVLRLTREITGKGYRLAGEPRWTGDGYFESVVLDVDGNRVEIVADRAE